MSTAARDWLLFVMALALIGLGTAAALEDSTPGFIAGYGTALAITAQFLARSMS